jgi:hypothetical protein
MQAPGANGADGLTIRATPLLQDSRRGNTRKSRPTAVAAFGANKPVDMAFILFVGQFIK